jgi:two-component system, OmpR family, sensor histidine kinase BaeS
MPSTLRARLLFSHVLPLVAVIPLIGLALYHLQTQVLLSNLTDDLEDQAEMLAVFAADNPAIFENTDQADAFVRHVADPASTQVTLYDANGHMISSGASTLTRPDLSPIFSGKVGAIRLPPSGRQDEIADVLVGVESPDHQVIGVVQLTRHMASSVNQCNKLYVTVAAVLGAGLLFGLVLGWVLALNIQRPISELSVLIEDIAEGERFRQVPERGPRELQSLAHAFNTLAENVQSLEEARRRLLANLVHELGRPLGALLAAVEALQGGAAEDTQLRSELLDGIKGEIGRLRHLLADLAQLSDRTLGELELNRRELHLSDWLPGVLATWRAVARARGLSWHAELPEPLPTITADADRLAQALGNLLSNAIKYTPKGEAVSVGVKTYTDAVRICVCDTGPGISPEEQERIFEPFHRAQREHRFPQGMGLGLAIAREIVVAHGGQVMLESSSEQGSEFVMLLPLADPS